MKAWLRNLACYWGKTSLLRFACCKDWVCWFADQFLNCMNIGNKIAQVQLILLCGRFFSKRSDVYSVNFAVWSIGIFVSYIQCPLLFSYQEALLDKKATLWCHAETWVPIG